LRTYLAERAPEVRAYLFLPTLTDRGVLSSAYRTHRWRRDMVSLAGTVGLINSTLLTLAIVLLGGHPIVAGVAFLVTFAGQIGYLQRRGRRTHADIVAVVAQRGLSEEPLVPRDGRRVGE